MSKSKIQTDRKILNAARLIFQKSGLNGARMQEIADEAGINKASLHYYYRSKDKLFQTVFQEDFKRFMIPLSEIIFRNTDLTVEKRILTFVESFTCTLIEHPHLPLFIIHEISRNPNRLLDLVKAGHTSKHDGVSGIFDNNSSIGFVRQIRDGINEGKYHDVVPEQFIISLIGMCVYPFVARPLIQHWLNQDEQQFYIFMEERKKEVTDFAFRILIVDYQPYDMNEHN